MKEGKVISCIFHEEMSHKTVIPLLPISMNIMSSKSVIKPRAFFKYSGEKCMVHISD